MSPECNRNEVAVDAARGDAWSPTKQQVSKGGNLFIAKRLRWA